MKTNILKLFVITLSFLGILSGCSKMEEIVFDHELPQFEVRNDAILLEVIMPQGTAVDDQIYIVGDFNGGEATALSDLKWQLEKAPNSNVKWGIYLNPNDFVAGKTLADGFHFVSKTQGAERTLNNEDPKHNLTVSVGSRSNVTVDRWASYFIIPENPEEIEHDGYVIYVEDNSGWDALTLYSWGDGIPELFGKWPGIQPTGIQTIDGVSYKYFDTGAANNGLKYNLIFNNNDGGTQHPDFPVTLDRDYFLEITPEGIVEKNAQPKHDGHVIYVKDNSGWDALTLYSWGDGIPELFGKWPGIQPTGTQTIDGVSYKYFDTGAANNGLKYNLIFNNNDGGIQHPDFPVTLDRDYFLEITPEGVSEVIKHDGYAIFIENKTSWDVTRLYAWGDGLPDLFGAWPGIKATGSTVIKGVTYDYYDTGKANTGKVYNLILNNNGGGAQTPDFKVTLDKHYYLSATATGFTVVNP